MIDDKEKAVSSIVSNAGTGLTASTSGLVRRGLQELSNRQNERSLVVPADVRRRILVVDDEEALVEVFGMVLDSAGYDVRLTLNAIEAIEIARTFNPHLAFVGLIMPRLDGIKLNAELLKVLPRLKIIFFAEAEPSDLEMLRKINPSCDILPTPFEKQEVLDKTRSWIAEAVELQRPRIMVVSAEEAINDVVIEMLNQNGCITTSTEAERNEGWPPEAVLQKAKAFRPDFIFMHRVWPGMTGANIARLLFDGLPEVKFIISTIRCAIHDDLLNAESLWYLENRKLNYQTLDTPFEPSALLAAVGVK